MGVGVILGQGDGSKLPLTGGKMLGGIFMDGNSITGLPEANNSTSPITKKTFDEVVHIVSETIVPNIYNDGKQRKRTWSNGHVEYISDVAPIGGVNNNVLAYAESLKTSGFVGIVPTQFYEGAQVPGGYCTGEIFFASPRITIIVHGFQNKMYRNAYSEGQWTGWKEFNGNSIEQ